VMPLTMLYMATETKQRVAGDDVSPFRLFPMTAPPCGLLPVRDRHWRLPVTVRA
jgi:hypothetical protein